MAQYLVPSLISFLIGILSVIVSILIAVLSVIAGIVFYYRQKEYELVRERYLDMTIDQVCGGLDHALSVFRTNYHICFRNLKLLKDLGKKCNLDLFVLDIRHYEKEVLSIVSMYRLKELIGTDLFWKLSQLTVVFVDNFNNYFIPDLNSALRLYCLKEIDSKGNQNLKIFNSYLNELTKLDQQSYKYYVVLSSLIKISTIIEKYKFSFKEIEKLRNRNDVQALISELEEAFKEDLKLEDPLRNQKFKG